MLGQVARIHERDIGVVRDEIEYQDVDRQKRRYEKKEPPPAQPKIGHRKPALSHWPLASEGNLTRTHFVVKIRGRMPALAPKTASGWALGLWSGAVGGALAGLTEGVSAWNAAASYLPKVGGRFGL